MICLLMCGGKPVGLDLKYSYGQRFAYTFHGHECLGNLGLLWSDEAKTKYFTKLKRSSLEEWSQGYQPWEQYVCKSSVIQVIVV